MWGWHVFESDGATRPERRRCGMNEEPILRKAYYSIGEVCDLTGLKPHVLRYWETQFEALRPTKNRAGNRVYRPREVELVLLVKHLLYEKKFTIDGARQNLRELRKGGELADERHEVAGPELFQIMKEELLSLHELLTLPEPGPPRSPLAPTGGAPAESISNRSTSGRGGANRSDVERGTDDDHALPPDAGSRTPPQAARSHPPLSPPTPSPDDPFPQLQLEVDDG